jgi:hypothetical protein
MVQNLLGKGEQTGQSRPLSANQLKHKRDSDGVLGLDRRFAIGSAKLDIMLVSSHGREKIVGHPMLRIAIDTCSGVCIGHSLFLEETSKKTTEGAPQIRGNTKMEVLRRLSLNWPVEHLPQILIIDRGELTSKEVEYLSELGIMIDVAIPMRPSSKLKL